MLIVVVVRDGWVMKLRFIPNDGCLKDLSSPQSTFWSYYCWSSILHMLDSLQNLRSCSGDQSIEYKILAWKMFSRFFRNEGQLVTRCQGVSSSFLHFLQVEPKLLFCRLLCLFKLQWPVMNCTILPSSNLLDLPSILSILLVDLANQCLVCLQLLRLCHLEFQHFSK